MSADWNNYDYGQNTANGGFYDSGSASYDFNHADAHTPASQPAYLTPSYDYAAPTSAPLHGQDQFENEPPLLEELGINTEHIMQKTLAVLNPFRSTRSDVAGDADLAGPLVFCLAFGSLLLLTGKVHFNYIYGIGVLGCLAMYGLLSLMAMTPVPLTVVVSVLGYCILPIVTLSGCSILFSLQGILGNLLAALAVIWCALSASNLFVTAFGMEHQQLLVAYPCAMLYAVFALITVF